jgi:hypothetical protein
LFLILARPSLTLTPLPITPNILDNNEKPKSRRGDFKCKEYLIKKFTFNAKLKL